MKKLRNFVYRNKINSLRHFRVAQFVYNFIYRKKLFYLKPLYEEFGLKRSYLSTIQFENIKHLSPIEPNSSEAELLKKMTTNPKFLTLPIAYQSELKKWHDQGFVHLKNFFESDLIDEVTKISEDLWESKQGKWRLGDRRVLLAFEHTLIWDFFHQNDFNLIVSLLLGQEITLLNSINFLRGDEQPIHSDSFYMSTFPIGKLIGSWVALENIDKDAGPLCYIPGSHKLPYVTNSTIKSCGNFWKIGANANELYIENVKETISKNGLSPKYHLPKKGDLFLWHANLLHGGSKIHDYSKTRKSMVGHFVGKNAICYHENSQRPAMRYSKPDQ